MSSGREGEEGKKDKEKKNNMKENMSTVADLIYCITQQVSPPLPNTLNHEMWINAFN